MSPSLDIVLDSQSDEYNDDPLLHDHCDDEDLVDDESETSDGPSGENADGTKRADNITKPGEHDVLLGRGGGTNNHCGNVKFRKLVNEHKMRYLACSKVEKPKVAREVVHLWRKLEPAGRFLTRKDDTKRGPGSVKAADNVWYEVGDKKAREKASQCLRERTPDVIPYIKHLREQQNAITEQGVSLVQQQLQMQEQAQQRGVAFQPVFPSAPTSMGPGGPAFPRRNSLPVPPQQNMGPVRSSAIPMNGRRGSLPVMNQSSGCVPPGGPTSAPFGRRTSLPGMSQQQMMMAQQQQQQQQMAGGFMFDGCVPEEEFFMGGDMNDMEYQQNMMMMEQQMQMQQMQMQRMQQQQQRMQQQQRSQRQQQPQAQMPQMGRMNPMMATSFDGNRPLQQPARRGVARNRSGNGSGLMGSFSNTFPDSMQPIPMNGMQRPMGVGSGHVAQQQLRPLPTTNGMVPRPSMNNPKSSMMQPNRRMEPPHPTQDTIPAPDQNISSACKDPLAYLQPADLNSEDNELSLEEYRQQLEEYITNSMSQNPNDALGLPDGGNDLHLKVDDDDDDQNASDLEDDWEKEKEKAYKQLKERNKNDKQRGVSRNLSGMSAMSTMTKGSTMGMSLSSGLTGLSDMMSATTDLMENQRESKMNMARSVSSNISIMSELTDLSQNIDNLSLYDDDDLPVASTPHF
jgi:hypothetical protein